MNQHEIDKIAALIYAAPLGEYIGRDGAAILAERAGCVRRLQDKEYLYRKDETTNSFYIVSEGRLALIKETSGGDQVLHVLEKGDLVGELSFIDQMPHNLGVMALGNATVLCFSADGMRPLITEHPELVYNFMRAVIKRVHSVVAAVSAQQMALEQYISTGAKGRG
ncbi:cyclic nucleotide-binding domain-containing protein [Hydrogenophaga sp.]|uniref:cyclic nucleotide-binding domain-containing protein n=1 Tax=Hydrogenophaga sp. TaxID=1904254 RepID=UPI001982AD18|nr:cyclic nucleotide-binding domain-containing protein [Hydrogenophaga sp.]MBD3893917.1 cyclic nucleotide-binding domain-containing protein [Hydrogenophaga sp.]